MYNYRDLYKSEVAKTVNHLRLNSSYSAHRAQSRDSSEKRKYRSTKHKAEKEF